MATVVLGILSLGIIGAVAQADVGNGLHGGVVTEFSTLRDPTEFLSDLRPSLPAPVVPFTKSDAVAHELRIRSKTLNDEEAVMTAVALCEEAEAAGFDPLLFLAVIHIESFYNHLAISPVGAEGLMQLMPYTADWFAERQGLEWDDRHSFEPVLNVRLGSRYLAMLHEKFRGRADLALTAYNRGPSATRHIVKRYGDLPEEIRDFYATKVLDRYRKLRTVYGHLPQG